MTSFRYPVVLLLLGAVWSGQQFDWRLRKGFPEPPVPPDNPMTAAKVELGRRLFYDKRLSVNGTQSCASCHRQELAFTDGRARAIGATGQLHPRSTMSLVNVGYIPALTWSDPGLSQLETQALTPMFGIEPVELGLKGQEARVLHELQDHSTYVRLFAEAFPGDSAPIRLDNITKAIAAFERTLISTRSPYDQYRYAGDEAALSDGAKRGEKIFFSSEKAGCFQCHGGWNFTGTIQYAGGQQRESSSTTLACTRSTWLQIPI